jgi:1-acyl-sn-glycerol-3-phosphate acyltransferase
VLFAAWLLVLLVPSRHFACTVSRFGSRSVLRLVGCRLEATGLGRLPPRGPLVLASNHASYTDVAVLLALLPFDVVFVAKREVLGNPFLRAFVRRCGHLTVERWDAQQSVAGAEAIAEALRTGARVLFFPEGTFTAATGLGPFRLGAFKAAAAAGAPVVPLALAGTRQVMRGDWKLPRPGRIRLAVGLAQTPGGTELPALLALRDGVRDAIAAECGEPRLDLLAAGPVSPPASDAEERDG